MCTLIRPLVFIVTMACALSVPFAIAAPPDDMNADGSIKTNNFIGHPTYDFSLFTALTSGSLNDTNNTETGPSIITGNVGVGGRGNFSMSDGQLNGDLYMNRFGKFTMSGPAQFNGTFRQSHTAGDSVDTTLTNALSGAQYLSNQANSEAATSNYTVNGNHQVLTNVNITQNTTTTIDITSGQKAVINLSNFVMTSGTFDLQGTAMQTYIINVAQNFSLNNSKIVLSGGISAKNVLFNIVGTGPTVNMQQGTSMQGILLAYQRQVDLSGGKVFGRVIAEQLTVTSGGQVISQ